MNQCPRQPMYLLALWGYCSESLGLATLLCVGTFASCVVWLHKRLHAALPFYLPASLQHY